MKIPFSIHILLKVDTSNAAQVSQKVWASDQVDEYWKEENGYMSHLIWKWWRSSTTQFIKDASVPTIMKAWDVSTKVAETQLYTQGVH